MSVVTDMNTFCSVEKTTFLFVIIRYHETVKLTRRQGSDAKGTTTVRGDRFIHRLCTKYRLQPPARRYLSKSWQYRWRINYQMTLESVELIVRKPAKNPQLTLIMPGAWNPIATR